MSLITSSLYNAVFLVVLFTSAVQKAAAQPALCGQYQTFNSTSGQYISKFKLCASNTTIYSLTRIHSSKQRLGCRRWRIAVHDRMTFPAHVSSKHVLSKGIAKVLQVEDVKDGTAFSTTWVWTANATYASQTQVHSYANVKSNSNTLPVMLSGITAFTFSANWTMYPSGTGNPIVFDIDGLDAIGAKTDVNLDFFLDPDIKQSTNVSDPKFEVMIWFAALDETYPIGYTNGSTGSTILDGQN